jgi:hypothetical protein
MLPDVPDPVAKFIVGDFEFPDEEIRKKLETGLASEDRRHVVATRQSISPNYR